MCQVAGAIAGVTGHRVLQPSGQLLGGARRSMPCQTHADGGLLQVVVGKQLRRASVTSGRVSRQGAQLAAVPSTLPVTEQCIACMHCIGGE